MSALPIREELIAEIKELSDEQVAKVLDFIRSVREEKFPYSEQNDPMLNGELFFFGASDLGERSEKILDQEYALKNEAEDKSE